MAVFIPMILPISSLSLVKKEFPFFQRRLCIFLKQVSISSWEDLFFFSFITLYNIRQLTQKLTRDPPLCQSYIASAEINKGFHSTSAVLISNYFTVLQNSNQNNAPLISNSTLPLKMTLKSISNKTYEIHIVEEICVD